MGHPQYEKTLEIEYHTLVNSIRSIRVNILFSGMSTVQ